MPPFHMTVSAHDPFRGMAIDVAGKYAEMAGGTAADVDQLTAALRGVLEDVSARAADGATVDLALEPNGHGVQVTITCGAETSVVRHPFLASKE